MFNITDSSGNRKAVNGYKLDLFCESSDNWQKCIWMKDDEKNCTWKYEKDKGDGNWKISKSETNCDPSMVGFSFKHSSELRRENSTYGVRNDECRIEKPKAVFGDRGNYKCVLMRCNEPKNEGCNGNDNGESITKEIMVQVKKHFLCVQAIARKTLIIIHK